MKSSNDDNINAFKIFDALSAQNLQINPFYIKIAGSITGGYLLTQLVYLFRGFGYKEFYQKDSMLRERLMLSEWELRSQKEELINRGLISIRLGQSKLNYYTVNIQSIINLAVDKESELKSINEDSSDSKTRIPRIQKRGILRYVYKEENTKQKTLNKNSKPTKKAHVDNSENPDTESEPGDVPIERGGISFEFQAPLPSYIQIQLSEIPGITTNTMNQFLLVPEYLTIDIIKSYQKNATMVRDVNKYLRGAIKNRVSKKEAV